MNLNEIKSLLSRFDQSHLLRFWDELTPEERQTLFRQIELTDFQQVRTVWEQSQAVSTVSANAASTQRIQRAAAPVNVIRQPGSEADRTRRTEATEVGKTALANGRVAVITVAGGQGTRLGFDLPKGMFPIGPVTSRTLFRIFAEQILARRQRHQSSIPWYIMTSDATHADTVEYFDRSQHFGLPKDSIVFFQQGSLPAVDASTGKILLKSRSSLALSPDGHGGLVNALETAGLLEQMEASGIDHVFYHQVDNPTTIIADPVLLGFHELDKSQMTTNVVCKLSPTEKMGVLVDIDGRTEIIEYSELTPEQSARHDAQGQWIFWAGNTATHVFDRAFLQSVAKDSSRLPFHIARKNVPHVDSHGTQRIPTDLNAIKFEKFIFDALPLARRTLIIEGDRAREFNPVKNKSGADSPETAREAMNRIARLWLTEAGQNVPEGGTFEISPLQALCAGELRQKLSTGELTMSDLICPTRH